MLVAGMRRLIVTVIKVLKNGSRVILALVTAEKRLISFSSKIADAINVIAPGLNLGFQLRLFVSASESFVTALESFVSGWS